MNDKTVIPPTVPKRVWAKLTADFIIEDGRLKIMLPQFDEIPEDFRKEFEKIGERSEGRNCDHITVDEVFWIFSPDWHGKHREATGEIE